MDTKPLVIGFYTMDTPYEHEAETLKLSLEPFGYAYELRGVPNLGTWQKNTQYKAEFIMGMMNEFKRPLLYLDVDCIMVQPPDILNGLEGEADIAAVHFADTNELLSGTIWLGNNPACHAVVNKWIAFNRQYPERLPDKRPAWDQRTLEMAIKAVPDARFYELPQSYTFITEMSQKRFPGLAPVLLHTRGAFRFKKVINRGGNYGD